MRNSKFLVSAILTHLIRFIETQNRCGSSIHFRPRVPFWPGAGFTREKTALRVGASNSRVGRKIKRIKFGGLKFGTGSDV